MKKLDLNYVVHFHDQTGKADEIYETEAATAGELIDELELRYPGFKDMLIRDGRFRAQNAMILSRKGVRAHGVFSTEHSVEDGDVITFL